MMISSTKTFYCLELFQLLYVLWYLKDPVHHLGVNDEIAEANKLFMNYVNFGKMNPNTTRLAAECFIVALKTFQNYFFSYLTLPSIRSWFYHMNDKSDPKSVLTWFYFILAPPLLFNHVCFNFDFFTNMIFLEVQSYQLEFASLKRKGKLVYHGLTAGMILWNPRLIVPYFILSSGLFIYSARASLEIENVGLRIKMLRNVVTLRKKEIVRENIGAMIAVFIVVLLCFIIPGYSSFIRQPELLRFREVEWNPFIASMLNRFFMTMAVLLFSLPTTPYELAYLVKASLSTPDLTEKLLITWTAFFFISAWALWVYLHEIDKFFTFVLHLLLGIASLLLFARKMNAFIQRRLFYSLLSILGIIWTFLVSDTSGIYIAIFILCGPSVMHAHPWRPPTSPSLKSRLYACLEVVFFTNIGQLGIMAVIGVGLFELK